MSYISDWLTLSEAITHIEDTGDADSMENLRRACADGNVKSRGIVDVTGHSLDPEWWHPGAKVEVSASRIVTGSTSQDLPIRTLKHKGDRLGPGDYRSIPVKGNLAEAVEVSRSDVEGIWPGSRPAEQDNTPALAPAMSDLAARPVPEPSLPTIEELQAEVHAQSEGRVPRYEVWDHVDMLTVGDSACLWSDEEPEISFGYQKMKKPTIGAYEALITGAIRQGVVQVDHSSNPLHRIGNCEKSVILREELRQLAESKGLNPKFLFPELRSATAPSPTEARETASTFQQESQVSNTVCWRFDEDKIEILETDKSAEANGQPSVGSSSDRRSGKFSPIRLRQWYEEWIVTNETTSNQPSRDEDWTAAKLELGDGVPRDAVWELRRELAPDSWTKKGRRKTVGD